MYDSPEYRRSRTAYIWECTFEYFVSLSIADTFLAKLLSSIGMSDALIGIVSSITSLALLFQFGSVFLMRRIVNTKRTAILIHSLCQLFFMGLYLIPFLPFSREAKSALFIVCILAGYFGNYIVTNVIYHWGNSFVEPSRRATFSASKEMISLASGIVVSLFLGVVIDYLTDHGNESGSFLFAAAMIFLFNLCDFLCLMRIKNDIRPRRDKKELTPLGEIFRNTLGKKEFLTVVLLSCVWSVGRYTTIGFLGTYQLEELGLSLTLTQVFTVAGNLGRFALSRPFGIYSDRHSYIKGLELGILVAAVGFGAMIFTVPATRFLIIVYILFYNVSLAGTNQNLMLVAYSYVDQKYFVEAIAIKNCISGLCGFGASLLASRLLSFVQENGNTFLGIPLYGQQLLAGLSLLFTAVTFLIAKFVVEKQTDRAR